MSDSRFPYRMPRRLVLAAALCATAFTAAAQDAGKFPSKPITVVVPQAAGGANDAIARVLAQRLSEQLGQPVVVDNRPGAGGNVGTANTAKAKADGYTLLVTADSAQVINPWLYKSTGFDPVKDFEPVAPLATAGYVLVAHPSFPAKNMAELIAVAKANPGKYSIASAGNGTLNHLIGEMLQKAAGIELQHIPYKGSAAAATDVVGGQVPLSVQSLPSSIAFIKAGKLKVLGVVNEKRVAALPDAPTMGETLKGFGQTPWYGMFAPAGTPSAVVAQLQAEVAKALDHKDVVDKLAAVGCEPFKGTSAQLGTLVKDDLARWHKVVQETGAKVD
ncbi:tripartite-type tricarboxylate transporter receptor subunit TctC [Acidovorax soli]|uniref:Tripartite-type tricarboxylate transporter receptor subunit TctC n=1 Tax=Acidovorax soli TaxID=592050 RepID=A0A7X0PLD8_9BURK|nr:tripartite-type tricarboxylate transporter receptor subunit TctC [Acidovorax soli]